MANLRGFVNADNTEASRLSAERIVVGCSTPGGHSGPQGENFTPGTRTLVTVQMTMNGAFAVIASRGGRPQFTVVGSPETPVVDAMEWAILTPPDKNGGSTAPSYLIWDTDKGLWYAPHQIGYERLSADAGRFSGEDVARVLADDTLGELRAVAEAKAGDGLWPTMIAKDKPDPWGTPR